MRSLRLRVVVLVVLGLAGCARVHTAVGTDGGEARCAVHADCDDGSYCDGEERCVGGRCVPGDLPCREDLCDEARAACLCADPDADGDGFVALACGGRDCDDGRSVVHPGAAERCNDRDDDCDGSIDEDEASDECERPGALGGCVAGTCAASGCVAPFLDCDDDPANGCEIDGSLDLAHCGACGHACVLDRCIDGVCDDPVAVTAGFLHSCALRARGGVICWGRDRNGEVGDGPRLHEECVFNVDCARTYVDVLDLNDAIAIEAGTYHSCAITASGAVRCWGGNGGNLGDGTRERRFQPVTVRGVEDATALALGASLTCLTRASGGVWCFGSNFRGQLGWGSSTIDFGLEPGRVVGIDAAAPIGAGLSHVCVREGSELFCWGDNRYAQLGDGTTTERNAPVPGPALADVVELTGGFKHTCARLGDGTVQCWGDNEHGQLGFGPDVGASFTPLPVAALHDAVQISGANLHTCARRASGTVACWGANEWGQLGDGTTADAPVPVAVVGISDAADVDAGAYHTCALTSEGRVLCWGGNRLGQLGDGTLEQRLVPTELLVP